MSYIHKKVKFPFEVTKGKAKDLYKLKFIRKSELEPQVRHHMRHTNEEMDKRLNLWYKEQQLTLGTLSRSQERLHQSRKRLQKEQKRIQKMEYDRKQEEIRSRLSAIRLRMMVLKVIQKFKDNAKQKQQARLQIVQSRTAANSSGGDSSYLRMPVYSASGRRMETIQEEKAEEEMVGYKSSSGNSLFGERVFQQSLRSSSGAIFDTSKSTIGTQTDSYTDNSIRSDESLIRNNPSFVGAAASKTLVVKIPTDSVSIPDSPRGSNKGTAGSGSESDDDTSSSSRDLSSPDSFGSGITLSIPDETNYIHEKRKIPIALDNYKDDLPRHFDNSINLHTVKYNIPDDTVRAELQTGTSSSTVLRKRNPFTLQYKERSFILKSKLSNPLLIGNQISKTPYFGRSASLHELDFPEDQRQQRYAERIANIQQNMNKEIPVKNQADDHQNMTVYGVRADTKSKLSNRTPPNTPFKTTKTHSRRPARSQLSVVLLNQKRAQNTDKRKSLAHTEETAQTYERTKDGKFLPFGIHKQRSFELPTRKERHEREKLLKLERNAMFNQQMKMKNFIDKFDTDVEHVELPLLQRRVHRPSRGSTKPSSTLGNIFFPDANEESLSAPKIVGYASRNFNSLSVLRNCRYLREYTPLNKEQALVQDKETSWQRKSPYKETYVANVRMQLF